MDLFNHRTGVSWPPDSMNLMNGRIQIQSVIEFAPNFQGIATTAVVYSQESFFFNSKIFFFQFSSSACKKCNKNTFGIPFLTVWKSHGICRLVRSSGTHELSAMWIQSADDLAKWGNPGGGATREYLKTNGWTPKIPVLFFFSEKKPASKPSFLGFLG